MRAAETLAATTIQAAVRGREERLAYADVRAAVTTIQAATRGKQQCAAFAGMRAAAHRLQAVARGARAARAFRAKLCALRKIQRHWRMRHFRRAIVAVRFQRVVRAFLCRKLLRGLRDMRRLRNSLAASGR